MDTAHMTTVQRLPLEVLWYMDDDIDGALIVADLLARWQPTRVLLLTRDDVQLASWCLIPEWTCVVCVE